MINHESFLTLIAAFEGGAGGAGGFDFSGFDFGDIFGDLFGFGDLLPVVDTCGNIHRITLFHGNVSRTMTRQDFDIYSTVPISYAVAALGGEIYIDTVDGKVIYDVKPGTQTVPELLFQELPFQNFYSRTSISRTSVPKTPLSKASTSETRMSGATTM